MPFYSKYKIQKSSRWGNVVTDHLRLSLMRHPATLIFMLIPANYYSVPIKNTTHRTIYTPTNIILLNALQNEDIETCKIMSKKVYVKYPTYLDIHVCCISNWLKQFLVVICFLEMLLVLNIGASLEDRFHCRFTVLWNISPEKTFLMS